MRDLLMCMETFVMLVPNMGLKMGSGLGEGAISFHR